MRRNDQTSITERPDYNIMYILNHNNNRCFPCTNFRSTFPLWSHPVHFTVSQYIVTLLTHGRPWMCLWPSWLPICIALGMLLRFLTAEETRRDRGNPRPGTCGMCACGNECPAQQMSTQASAGHTSSRADVQSICFEVIVMYHLSDSYYPCIYPVVFPLHIFVYFNVDFVYSIYKHFSELPTTTHWFWRFVN